MKHHNEIAKLISRLFPSDFALKTKASQIKEMLKKLKFSVYRGTTPSYALCKNCEHATPMAKEYRGTAVTRLLTYGCNIHKGRCTGFKVSLWRQPEEI